MSVVAESSQAKCTPSLISAKQFYSLHTASRSGIRDSPTDYSLCGTRDLWHKDVLAAREDQLLTLKHIVCYSASTLNACRVLAGEAFFGDGVQGWNTSSAPSLVKYGTSADSLTLTTAGYSVGYAHAPQASVSCCRCEMPAASC